MKLEMCGYAPNMHIQVAVWFLKMEAHESSIILLENKLIDGETRKSSCEKSEVSLLDFPIPLGSVVMKIVEILALLL